MRRRYVITLIAAAVVLFLVISALLTRALSVGSGENAAITNLVTAESHGDTAHAISLIYGCGASASCRARAAAVTASLRTPGTVSIVQIQGTTGFSLSSTATMARVAWVVGSSLPRVQCVRIRDTGNLLQGFSVQLYDISRRIKSNADCPRSF